MRAHRIELPVIAIPGLRPDSLGSYLASLGLLRALSRRWPTVRIAWREDVLRIVGGPANLDELLDELMSVATNRCWTPYQREWAEAQKKGTKAKSGMPLAIWQAAAKEEGLELFAAHAVPHARVSFNPLLGSGGNAGKRAFSDGWTRAMEVLAPPAPKKPSRRNEAPTEKATREEAEKKAGVAEAERKRGELKAYLLGKPLSWLVEKLNAASWFSEANKLYNSGQRPYREEPLSPWAMVLACEGLAFLAGGASRRLGARARAKGAFPFVTEAVAPRGADEAGRDLAEFWAPIWERPMTLAEVRTLFARGRAELHGRGALTPGAFATAVMQRGVDAGVSEFRRFALGRTTSANTFEPRYEGTFRLASAASVPSRSPHLSETALTTTLERIVGVIERLPRDEIAGKRKRFIGLRGPVEAALIRLAAKPAEAQAARELLDAVTAALDRVDRVRAFRERGVSWVPLPIEWLPSLFADEAPGVEARLALALVSGFPRSRPFALYRFGVEWNEGRWQFDHPGPPPARWVWGPGALQRVLSAVLIRRILDWETAATASGEEQEADRDPIPAACADVSHWLDSLLDEELLARWTSRLALFDWRFMSREVRALARPSPSVPECDGSLLLFGLLRPFFDRRPLNLRGDPAGRDVFGSEAGARTPGVARALANLVRVGRLDAAVRLALSRYAVARTPLARTNAPWNVADPERLLASLLFTISSEERSFLVERWLRPQRNKEEPIHA